MDKVPERNSQSAPAARRQVGGALAALALSTLLCSLGTSIVNVALPTLAGIFAAPFQTVQWLVIAYLLALTSLIVGAGRLGDIWGRRRLLAGGLALFVVASVLCALATDLLILIFARALQGAGAAVMMALTMTFVGDTVPKERTGRAMGLLGTLSAVGTALGPSAGGLLIASSGWQSIFWVNVPLGLVTLFLAIRFLPADAQRGGATRQRFDYVGLVLMAATLGTYALAMTIGHGRFNTLNMDLLVVAAISLGLFLFVEMSVATPLVRLSALADPTLAGSLLANMLVSTVMMATLVVGPFYLARVLALDPAMVGLAMSAGPAVSALSGVPAGRLVDRYGSRFAMLGGLVVLALGALTLSLLPATSGLTGYILPLMLMTASYALFQAANNTAVMTGVLAVERGVMSGFLNLSRNLGLVTGASFMGGVFAWGAGGGDIAAAGSFAVASGMHASFAVSAAMAGTALLLVFMIGMRRMGVRPEGQL